jgi:beta-lactamase regulating signal transducer with metallopeptidase domain
MEQIFLTILRMSLSACPVILAVLLVRLLLTGAPKKWSYLLWSVVGFRLICPVSFQAAFSLFSAAPMQMQPMQPMHNLV